MAKLERAYSFRVQSGKITVCMTLLINVLTQKFELLLWMANSESGEAMHVYNNVQDKAHSVLKY